MGVRVRVSSISSPGGGKNRDDSLLHVQKTLGKKELVPSQTFDFEVEAVCG